ncbi:MAG: 1-deoxy-D-xylulose-5-phosphate reductoisomerase [Bacillota bacterium]
MKNLVLLGSTGSIGTQTLEVIDKLENWNILALTANTNIDLLEKQAKKYHPKYAVLMKHELAKELDIRLRNTNIEVLSGLDALNKISGISDTDLVINALVGAVGLGPSLSALKAGNKLGLANKESMVIGGKMINDISDKKNVKVLPIDSEHNAIFRILENNRSEEIKKIWLTASGGPFFRKSFNELKKVSVEEALDHPNWDMGKKITIDSATFMNKGLEVIEAHWLFKQEYDKIKVVVHPESIIHSLVEFIDNSWEAELGASDMRIPIQYVLSYPAKVKGPGKEMDLFQIKQMNFNSPDIEKFPCLNLAYTAGKKGGSMPIVLNAANEIAVSAFLDKKISFLQIPEIIEKVMFKHRKITEFNLEKVFQIDVWARRRAEEVIEEC